MIDNRLRLYASRQYNITYQLCHEAHVVLVDRILLASLLILMILLLLVAQGALFFLHVPEHLWILLRQENLEDPMDLVAQNIDSYIKPKSGWTF